MCGDISVRVLVNSYAHSDTAATHAIIPAVQVYTIYAVCSLL